MGGTNQTNGMGAAKQTMGKRKHVSMTPATAFLTEHEVVFTEHVYDYVAHGGAAESARQLGVDGHEVVKTLIMEDDSDQPHVVLMHGDCEVSLKNLARDIGVKKMQPAPPLRAPKHSGYQLGGTSPFGTRKHMPVWVEASIFDLPRIYINGGRRGYLIAIDPAVLVELLAARPVHAANAH